MKYSIEFWDIMLKKNSSTAQLISEIRWNFIKELNPKVVLDYGSGVGFFRAFRPEGIEVDTYDIGQYPQTGILHGEYDIICFWDVLEHMANFHEVKHYFDLTKYVALTTPLITEKINLRTWKHFKPEEHLHYYSETQLDIIFGYYGFEKVKAEYVECPPRQDVKSFIYKRNI